MDSNAVRGRRRRDTTRESTRDRVCDSFLREAPRYEGRDEDFERVHARLYGEEERLGPDGKHHHGSSHFPRGSDRQKLHTRYSRSTKPRDNARDTYQDELAAAEKALRRMDIEERRYYRDYTGGLAPHQHERLDPRAERYRDICFENAENRRTMLEKHPYGYHSAEAQNQHHRHAQNAYVEYEYAKDRQQHHQRYRSYSNLAPRRTSREGR